MILVEQDLEFDFTDAVDAFKFEPGHDRSYCMKAVDFVVELPKVYLFVEVKDPSHPNARAKQVKRFEVRIINGQVRDDLVMKFRDSFVYRWAEDKLDKPVHFLSLIELEEALLNNLQDEVHRTLPFEGPTRWSRKIAESCNVLSLKSWNRNFPKWPVKRLSGAS